MRVKLTTSGGMLASPPRIAAVLDQVPHPLVEKLRQALATGALAAAELGSAGAPLPDSSQQVLEVEDDDGTQSRFEIDEGAASAEVLDLLDELVEAAEQSE